MSLPAPRLRSWLLAILPIGLLLLGGEMLARSASVSDYIARRPSDITSEGPYAAKIAAFARASGPKVMVLGDSVALGKVMADHGITDWQSKNLSSALSDELRTDGHPVLVADFSTNGLLPSESAQAMRDGLAAGATAIVIVVGLRGFSADFETVDQQYGTPWRRSRAIGARRSSLDELWATKPITEFLISEATGGPLSRALTEMRERHRWRPPDEKKTAFMQLQARQRLSTVSVDKAERFQARALFDALEALDARGVPAIAVYASEDPIAVRRLMMPANLQKGRDELAKLVGDSGRVHRYLGPDPALDRSLLVDHIHPAPEGYRHMARRIAPVLIEATRGRSGSG